MSVQQEAMVQAAGIAPAAPVSTTSAKTIRVWDPFVRIFHWSLVGLFVAAFVTGDEIEWLHILLVYAIATLVALRIVWGIVGSRYARFSNFARSPRTIVKYVAQAARWRAPRYLGHNPAGAAMIIALLLMIAGIAVTGFAMTTDALWGAKWVEELHEGLAYATVGLIGLHIAGVIFSSLAHRENLVKAMVTGRKRAP